MGDFHFNVNGKSNRIRHICMHRRTSESIMPAPHSQFHTIFKKFIRMKIAFQVVWAVNGRENIRETKCVAFAYLMHISREWWKCCCKKLPVLKRTYTDADTLAHEQWENERLNERKSECRTRNLFTWYALKTTDIFVLHVAFPFSLNFECNFLLTFENRIEVFFHFSFQNASFTQFLPFSLIFYYFSHYRCISEHVLSRQTRKSKMYLA